MPIPSQALARRATAALLLLPMTAPVLAQAAPTVIDINQTSTSNLSSSPRTFAHLGAQVLFFAVAPNIGRELHVTSGVPGTTRLVKDIVPGLPGATVFEMVAYRGAVYFTVRDRTNQAAGLWRSDGTAQGTYAIAPNKITTAPTALTVSAGRLFFAGGDSGGIELWSTDGTNAGTVQAADIQPGRGSSMPRDLMPFGSGVLFTADDGTSGRELWYSTGIVSGTAMVTDIDPGVASSSPTGLVAVGGTILFRAKTAAAGEELWRTDGTSVGTRMVIDLVPGVAGSYPNELTRFGTDVYFSSQGKAWKTDGSAAGTSRLAPAIPISNVMGFTEMGGALYFSAGPFSAQKLWRTDGTTAGTAQIGPNLAVGPIRMTVAGTQLFFFATAKHTGPELFATDGTIFGTRMVKDIWPGSTGSMSTFGFMTPNSSNTGLLFCANDGTHGIELWGSDGTVKGTSLVSDINPPQPGATRDSNPRDFFVHNGISYFSADDGVSGRELWRSDGSVGGTYLVADIKPGPSGSGVRGFASVGDKLFFLADDGLHGTELWLSNGTLAGTRMVRDIRPGQLSSGCHDLTALRGRLYLLANDGIHGLELWASDGSMAGTAMVVDTSILWTMGPSQITVHRDKLYFANSSQAHGLELWVSDGTAANTKMLIDLWPGPMPTSGSPVILASLGDNLLFAHSNGQTGLELWKTDGTAVGTSLLRDINPGIGAGLFLSYMVSMGDYVLFNAISNGNSELWRSDGSVAGTRRVVLNPGTRGPYGPKWMQRVGSIALFMAQSQSWSGELWRTDGTAGGTFPLTNYLGTEMISGAEFAASGSRFGWFVTSSSTTSTIRRTDGSVAGTKPAYSTDQTNPALLTHMDGKLLFNAVDSSLGRELFVLDVGASSSTVGRGWGEAGRDLRLEATDPVLAGTMLVKGTNANLLGNTAVLLSWPTVQPSPLIGGLFAHVALGNSATLSQFTSAGSNWQVPVSIPNIPGMSGITLVMQAIQWPARTPVGFEGSNAVRITFGR